MGNQLTAANNAGAYTMTYDAANEEISQTGLYGVTLTFTYDNDSNQTSMQDSKGGLLAVVYNADSDWTTREMSGTSMTPMQDVRTYNADEQKATDSLYNSLTVSTTYEVGQSFYTWSAGGDLTNETYKNGTGSTVLQQVTYTYDLAHRVTSRNLNGTSVSYTTMRPMS